MRTAFATTLFMIWKTDTVYDSLTHSRFEKWAKSAAWWISPAIMMISKFFFVYLIRSSGFLPPRQGLSLCRQNPCLNGGVCATNAHLDSFDCVCPDGFTGALCEKSEWNTVKWPYSHNEMIISVWLWLLIATRMAQSWVESCKFIDLLGYCFKGFTWFFVKKCLIVLNVLLWCTSNLKSNCADNMIIMK